MSDVVLVLVWALPLLLAPLAVSRMGRWVLPVAVAPALLASWSVAPGASVELPWLLLGARLGLDAMGRVFLAFGAVLWLCAGLSASIAAPSDPRAGRFRLFFLLAMSGNLGLVVAHDLATFYLGFALMSLAAYGLVVHDGTERARRAGRVYLVLTIVGEMALFAGFLLLVRRSGSLAPAAIDLAGAGALELWLLVLALGIKAGLLGLHMWLPLAHPAAPVPASAVLSGVMIKAGLLGWLRFLPLGRDSMPILGSGLMAAGGVAAFAAVVVGLSQRDPKVVLAYSSIAKIGTMALGLGIAAARPALAPALTAALVTYAAHHGLAKGALFLGVGVVQATPRRWPLVVQMIPALVLAGAPATSGAAAKAGLKQAAAGAVPLLELGLSLAAVGTALLLMHFVALLGGKAGTSDRQPALALPWIGLVAASLALPALLGGLERSASDLWPLLAALAIGVLVTRAPRLRWSAWLGRVPPGDVLEPLSVIGRTAWRASRRWAQALPALDGWRAAGPAWREAIAQRTQWLEQRLSFGTVGPLWLALIVIVVVLMVRP